LIEYEAKDEKQVADNNVRRKLLNVQEWGGKKKKPELRNIAGDSPFGGISLDRKKMYT